MATIEKSEEQTNVEHELTDEEIEMAAGGSPNCSVPLPPPPTPHVGFLQAIEGLADIIAGHATNNPELAFEGLIDLGLKRGI